MASGNYCERVWYSKKFSHAPVHQPVNLKSWGNSKLKVYFHNVGGSKHNLTHLRAAVDTGDYDVIVLVETWWNKSVKSGVVFDDKVWEVFRKDRHDTGIIREGGGVLIAVKKYLCPSDVNITCTITNEIVWSKLCLIDKDIIIGAVYIPPSCDNETYNAVASDIDNVVASMNPQDDIFIFGDFNLNLEWLQDCDNPLLLRPTGSNCDFTDKLSSIGLAQICNMMVRNQQDLIFTNVDSNFMVSPADYSLKKDSFHH